MADTYDIGTPSQTTILAANGSVVEAYEVPFIARASGATGSVKIPKTMFSADEVARIVEAEVKVLDAVAAL